MDKLSTKAKVSCIRRGHGARFEVATNLKTARTLGLGIPRVVPTRVDRAIP